MIESAADRYRQFLETLSPESLALLGEVAAPEIHFTDPFNDVHGIDKFRTILADMFAKVPDVSFTVQAMYIHRETAMMHWTFTATLFGKPWIIDGVSRVTFDTQGLVTEHIDYWDASTYFYMRLPVIGGLLRLIKRQASAT